MRAIFTLNSYFDNRDSVALFGGLNYELEPRYPENTGNFLKNKMTSKSKWTNLPGTTQEVDEISKLVRAGGGVTKVFTKDMGTERAVVSLQGRNCPGILHFATHGFYNNHPVEEISRHRTKRFTEAMNRSGLVLSPEPARPRRKKTFDSHLDGILTSSEVVNMNFSNARLAVLAACETGRGDVIGSEGVFGLGRAFLLSGVDHILVSLWPISDKETAEFMKQFYYYLYLLSDFQYAFWNAETYMRDKYRDQPRI